MYHTNHQITVVNVTLVRLTGALSNQATADGLEALLGQKRQFKPGVDGVEVESRPLRPPQGAIQGAVLEVLRAASGPLRVAEIHSGVEAELGRAVSRDTVASFLSVGCRPDVPTVLRVERGRYKAAG